MGNVACFAAIHADRRMFKRKWPAHSRMAFQASLFVNERLVHKLRARRHAPCGSEGSVRIVTIRALHEPFVHPVFERHRKLRADVGMAAIAKIRLRFGEKPFWRRCLVDGMAIRAANVTEGMRGPANIRAGNLFLVAGEARVDRRLRIQKRECDDRVLAAASLDMFLARSVTTFTTCFFKRLFSGGNALVVRIPEEAGPHIGMARLASSAADEPLLRHRRQRQTQKPCEDPPSN